MNLVSPKYQKYNKFFDADLEDEKFNQEPTQRMYNS